MAETPTVHLYGQGCWHDEAAIVGNRAGLVALADAIRRALESGTAATTVYAGDGEGYRVIVLSREDADKHLLPYADTSCVPRPAGVLRWRLDSDAQAAMGADRSKR